MKRIQQFLRKILDLILHSNPLVSQSYIGGIIFLSLVILLGGILYLVGGPWWTICYMMVLVVVAVVVVFTALLMRLAARLAITVVLLVLSFRKMAGFDDEVSDDFREQGENENSWKKRVVVGVALTGIPMAVILSNLIQTKNTAGEIITAVVTLLFFGYMAYSVRKILNAL